MKNAPFACAGLAAAALSLTATVAAAQTAPAASPPFPTTPTAPVMTGAAWGTAPQTPAGVGGVGGVGGVTASGTATTPAPTPAVPALALPPGSRLVPTGDGGFVVQGPAPAATVAPAVTVTSTAPMASRTFQRPPRRVWYGWQTLVVDGAGLLVGALAASNESSGIGALASLNYAFGAPIVHAAHGEGIRSLASIGLRTALPGAVGLLGYALSDGNGSSADSAVYTGIVLGALGAIAIDAGVVAYEEHCYCTQAQAPKKDLAKAFRLTPTVAPRAGGGGMVGVVGNF